MSSNFVETFAQYFRKLPNKAMVNAIWKEIISGKECSVSSDQVIDYAFHYPVDTEMYLEELHQKFEDCIKEDLRTIDGSLKGYLQTFLYYCIGSQDRIPIKTSLLSAQLYLKILLIPSGIGQLYYEENIFLVILGMLNKHTKKDKVLQKEVVLLIELLFKFASDNEVATTVVEVTTNVFANIIKHKALVDDSESDALVKLCLNCLKEFINIKENPIELKYIMESPLRCLRRGTSSQLTTQQRKAAVLVARKFLTTVMLTQIEDTNKLQYFIDSLFEIFGMPDFDYIEDCVIHIINSLDEKLYKEVLHRIPKYLQSKNHYGYYCNLMYVVYYMLKNPHPNNLDKLDVLFAVCFQNIVAQLLNTQKYIKEKALEIVGMISVLHQNPLVLRIFQMVNETDSFVNLPTDSVLYVLVKLLRDIDVGPQNKNKYILSFLSKMLVHISKVDDNMACEALLLISKDGTPYSMQTYLPDMHDLFLQLTVKPDCPARIYILQIFFKMAMHPDNTASVYQQHLYKSMIFNSTSEANGKTYGPEEYSNMILSEEFDFKILLPKFRNLIRYDHISHLIANFKFRERGYPILLHCLLNYVEYKEYEVLTDYIATNLDGILGLDTSFLIDSFRKILVSKGQYSLEEYGRKFHTIHAYLWHGLYSEESHIANIKPSLGLIDLLREILQLPDETQRKQDLLLLASERAYKDVTRDQFFLGSVMHLTELCIALKAAPSDQLLIIIVNVMLDPRSFSAMVRHHRELLIQLTSFFGTLAMMKRSHVATATKLFKMAIEVEDPLIQFTTIKGYYLLASDISKEFEDIIKFCFAHLTSTHTILVRTCFMILEELVHESRIMLDSENFIRFVHRLASHNLSDFMKVALEDRFVVSNKNDIGRYFMPTLVYMSGYTKWDEHPISRLFEEELHSIRKLLHYPKVLIGFLFGAIQTRTRINILLEMCTIIDSLVAGRRKVDDNFFVLFTYFMYTFKVMSRRPYINYRISFYADVYKFIDKELFHKTGKVKQFREYEEFEVDVRKCTNSLLRLFDFILQEPRLEEHLLSVFDVVACWIDHFKVAMLYYVRYDKGHDYDFSVKKVANFYAKNKTRLENYLDNQEPIIN
ncbi:uncharacterized protein LOC126748930 [Anthonomus grandis grandis]|uniref:uncharacterized protein LOC126748930 n=1 Tax=Anthonomus grandis grandis TaxID=2921223 RepID=UPI002166B93A|nr:uncharacterized protein LOC126748930 [Anthonomus grandis grandis]